MKSYTSSSSSAASERIDPKWAWHHRTLLTLRQKLVQAQASHEKTATAPAETSGVDTAEAAQGNTTHTVMLAELQAEADRMLEIEAALQRLRKGTYGICEETGKTISAERLRAVPWTRYSRSAAERAERNIRPTPSH